MTDYPREYDRPPVYDRVPSLEATERVLSTPRLTIAKAVEDELPAAVRATLTS